MPKLPLRVHHFKRARCAFGMLLIFLFWSPHGVANDLNIQTEADYQQMLDGVRAAEYSRQNYLESETNPRAIIATVGVWVFAERNPQATPEQLSAFLSAYDSALSSQITGDPDLSSFGSVLSAVGGAFVSSDGVLIGTDTRVGSGLIERLGVSLPGLFNYEQSQQRMSQFDLASVQRLIQRRETMDALTAILAGVTPGGERPERLGQIAAAYLTAQGLAPQLGSVDSSKPEINQGLANLPTYTEFLAIRDTPGQHLLLEQANFSAIDQIQSQGELLLQNIGTPEPDLGQFLDALSLSLAASDPGDPNHAAAVAELEARRQAIIASSRSTAAQRAGVFARTLLLQQSSFDDVRAIATHSRSYAALQLQTNNSLAIAEQSFGIAGSLLGVVAGFKSGDPWGAVQSITDVITGAFGLASLFGPTGPSAEEQIFDQIVELRQQVEDMRVQLNGRFDIVDQKLNQLFSTMSNSFADIGFQIGDIQGSLDEVAVAIAQQRSALDRIENALFGFANDVFLSELSARTNGVLNYFNNNGISLPYSGAQSSFIDGADYFFTFATSTAKNSTFAGTPEGTDLAVSLDNAATTLNDGETAIARYINDLRRLPEQLSASDGSPVGALSNIRIAAPSPWSQAAAAYLQLARENPWYFNYRYETQLNSPGSTRIDDIIEDGERILNFANTVRSETALFDALLTRASQGADEFKQAALQQLDQILIPLELSNGSARVDAWGALDQPASELMLPLVNFTVLSPTGTTIQAGASSSEFVHSGFEVSVADQRFGFPADISRAEIAERNALSHIFEFGPSQTPRFQMIVNRGEITETGGMDLFQVLITTDPISTTVPNAFINIRTVSFTIEVLFSDQWLPLGFVPFGIPPWEYINFVSRAINNGLLFDLAEGSLVGATYDTGTLFPFPFPVPNYSSRIRVRTDASSTNSFAMQTDYLSAELFQLRQTLRPVFLSELANQGSLVNQAAERLNNDSALLDAYLTIGMADGLTQSELLRSAVRGSGSIAGLGFRSSDIDALVVHDSLEDSGSIGGTIGAGLTQMDDILNERINALRIEINEAANTEGPSFPYVEFILAELRQLREQAQVLAIDETYTAGSVVIIDASEGLLSNDIGQAGQISQQELVVDLAFFNSPEAIQPENGTVVVAENGSFTYTPDPGFNGIERFSYRLKSNIPGVGQEAVSLPADVVLRVGNFDDRIFSDGFEFGFQ